MSRRLLWRLTAPITGMSILLLCVGGIAALYLHLLQRRASQLVADSVASAEAATEIERALNAFRDRLTDFVENGKPEQIGLASEHLNAAGKWLEQAQKVEVPAEGEDLMARIHNNFLRVSGLFDEATAIQPRDELVRKAFVVANDKLTVKLLLDANEYHQMSQRNLIQGSTQNQETAHRIGLALILLGVCGATAGLLSGYDIARAIQESIIELSVPVHTAAGQLNEVVGPLRVATTGNIEDLQETLDDMAQRVATVVGQLHEAQRDALRSEQLAALGQLAAGLAHELRNPLTAMKTLVQSAREQEDGQLDARDLAVLEEEISRLNRSIQTFLDYARPPKPCRGRVSLREIVDSTLQLVAGRANQQRITLRSEIDDNLPPLFADGDQIKQVLLNLVLNACDAQPGGGVIEIDAQTGGTGNGNGSDEKWLTIRVNDEGSGLPENLRERIFEPFTSTKDSGSGLGLSICRRIVEEHGGTISAADRQPRGAVFTVRLPLEDVPAENRNQEVSPPAPLKA